MEVGERRGKVVDGAEEQVLGGAGGRLDRGGTERRLALGRKEHPMDAGGLGASKDGSEIRRRLERVEDEDERRLGAGGGAFALPLPWERAAGATTRHWEQTLARRR